ncbi:FadR family transcriptional regulator [Streptomyces sp. RB6PN25]|uniref:FadR family transcriptional regulator n=1 Tax=Streptomyces humicola TaxID=2953240 RepID=A0ABT1PNC6_9ACTN|nr:FadR/GntR family transcriptional regulator [Streptomyces humicola]MCQ4079168.1 FadR family transcriptional regulator [Streptomyces humicola]
MPEAAPARRSGNRQSAIQLAPMEVPKSSDVLAGELRERILNGEFAEGSALPPEREIVVQTQMSRATVREALRILEVQGLVRIKTGRAGGAFVQRPGKESVAGSVSLLIRGQQIRFSSLLETREAIEPYCAKLAAVNRTDDDLVALEAANAALDEVNGNLAAFLQANVDWHVAVATASRNELLAGFMASLSRAIYTATENERFVDAEVRRLTARAHRSITKAIRAQDPDAAVRRMNRHVHSYAAAVLKIEERTEIAVPGSE